MSDPQSDDWGDFGTDSRTGEVHISEGDEQPEPPALRFPTLDRFVLEYLVLIYRRDTTATNIFWCKEWFKHAEAIARLEGMWRAWEKLRLDPGEGGSNWWLGHADPHMRVLLSEDGPFKHCRKGGHVEERSTPLPSDTPPAGLFDINA